jgi:capsular exopolysaccharide synthesis family protein
LKSATHAEATPGFARLFDLRDTARASERSDGDGTFADQADRRLIVHPEADPVFVEQYRRLGAALHAAQLQRGIRSVTVASAVEAEGKTLSATNLALTLSRSFRKSVLLVDADLRKPAVHRLLQLENGVGLSDVLKQPGGPLPMQTLSSTLSVITSGHPDPDPVGLLASDAARQFLAETRDRFDWVVVDTPPIVLFPDAGLIAGRLDTSVMVVSAATTATPVAAKAVAAIGASRILGIILNRAEPTEIAAGYGYGQYLDAGSGGRSSRFSRWRAGRRALRQRNRI